MFEGSLPLLILDVIQSAQRPCTHSTGGQVRAWCSWVLAGPACLLISRSQGRTGLRGSTRWQQKGKAGLKAACWEGKMSLSSTQVTGGEGPGRLTFNTKRAADRALHGHRRPL